MPVPPNNYVAYSSDPVIRWDSDTDQWYVEDSFDVIWSRPGAYRKFTVEAGFTTDLASIPRLFRSIIPQVGDHIQPSIAHDWCFEDKVPGMTRAEADLLFLDGMKSVGVWWLRRYVMYLVVRAFGWALWG